MGDGNHILSAERFGHAQLIRLFERADQFRSQSKTVAGKRRLARLHQGRQLCTLFFQPSTRTRVSFETAAVKLGMGVVSTENAREHSSAAKGETIEDTFRVLDRYGFDVIVLRHYEQGAAVRAAGVCATPIINAGDGAGEHPTQALLDTYTIHKLLGRLDNLRIIFGGDLERSRTIKSLVDILQKYSGNSFVFIAPPQISLRSDVAGALKRNGMVFEQTGDMTKGLKNADVVYWSRLQAEYLQDASQFAGQSLILDKKTLKAVPKTAVILHALPRVDEIDPEVDDDPRAKYFDQAGNGLYVRMALLDSILTGKL
ncbi:MAG TPA: aspartate carbamoyltransferase [Candidatus Saccharimonadales bacterium]|nr:aspartate carbamoyltransferase [Candidatus Saccharimonadales bacterium]